MRGLSELPAVGLPPLLRPGIPTHLRWPQIGWALRHFRRNGVPLNGSFFGQSSFAEYAVVEERSAVKVPAGVPVGMLGPMGCGVITGAGAVLRSMGMEDRAEPRRVWRRRCWDERRPWRRSWSGHRRLLPSDQNPARLDLAIDLGATHAIRADAGADVVGNIRKIVPRGVDRSLNTTSTAAVFDQAIECLGPTGVAAFVTIPRGPWSPNMMKLLTGGKTLKAIQGGDADPQQFIPMLIQQWQDGAFSRSSD